MDEYIASLYNQKDLTLPIYRISEGNYLIGTEKKKCTIKGNNCLVRVGGGYQSLEEYLERNESEELKKMKKQMEENEMTYVELIRGLLQKYECDEKQIKKIIK